MRRMRGPSRSPVYTSSNIPLTRQPSAATLSLKGRGKNINYRRGLRLASRTRRGLALCLVRCLLLLGFVTVP
jgi:hypothetical protein